MYNMKSAPLTQGCIVHYSEKSEIQLYEARPVGFAEHRDERSPLRDRTCVTSV